MSPRWWAAAFFLAGAGAAAAPPPASGVPSDRLLTGAVAAYRDGRLSEALSVLAAVIERDPSNDTAKNYLWTISKKLQERDGRPPTPGEKRAAEVLALKRLRERRAQTQGVMAALQDRYKKSRHIRSPTDMLASLEGLDRFLGLEFVEERERYQAKRAFEKILDNLQEALSRKAFVSEKDKLYAEGYLAYYGGDWKEASRKWEEALKADPKDNTVRTALDSLRALIEKKEKEREVGELLNQAALYEDGGYLEDAVAAWDKIVQLDPSRPGVKAKRAVAKVALEKQLLRTRLQTLTDQGMDQYKRGDLAAGMQTLLEVLRQDPSYERARVMLSHLGKKLEETSAAPVPRERVAPEPPVANENKAVLKKNPEKAQSLYREGLILYSQDQILEAIRVWEEALRFNPDLSNAREALRQAKAELTFR